jgi:hypothetical protein
MKTLKISDELHKRIKIFCAENELKINDWVEKELMKKIESYDNKSSIIKPNFYKLKSESIPLDKEIVDLNPQIFEILDWKSELLTHLKVNKLPTPSQLHKKLVPFIEEMVLSSIQSSVTVSTIDESKLKESKLRARRNGAHNIDYRVIDSSKVIKKLHEKADRVLIDAPCSGLGVLKRNPDSKWKLQPEFIDNIKKVQAEVLENYSKIVKPGGKLVYATCSILPSLGVCP